MPITITELNHAVLYVRDVPTAVAFYTEVLGFGILTQDPAGRAAFLRAGGSDNHHDLGLIAVGEGAPRPASGSTGLYHLAWKVDSIHTLVEAKEILARRGALVGQSDHGVTKSIYAADPDGNEFELLFEIPRRDWGDFADQAVVLPLDLDAEVARYG